MNDWLELPAGPELDGRVAELCALPAAAYSSDWQAARELLIWLGAQSGPCSACDVPEFRLGTTMRPEGTVWIAGYQSHGDTAHWCYVNGVGETPELALCRAALGLCQERQGASSCPTVQGLTVATRSIPIAELGAYRRVLQDAEDLARGQEVLNGYRCLLAAKDRAEEQVLAGQPWGADLVALYTQALRRYGAWFHVRIGEPGAVE